MRLGLYLLAESDIDANEKIRIIIDHDTLSNYQLDHESFRVLRTAYAEAKPTTQAELCSYADKTYMASERDGEDRAYSRFNLYTFLLDATPGNSLLNNKLDEIHIRYPHFEKRQYQDLHFYTSEARISSPQPLTPEEFTYNGLIERISEIREVPFGSEAFFHRIEITTSAHPQEAIEVVEHCLDQIDESDNELLLKRILPFIKWENLYADANNLVTNTLFKLLNQKFHKSALRGIHLLADGAEFSPGLWILVIEKISQAWPHIENEERAAKSSDGSEPKDYVLISINHSIDHVFALIEKALSANDHLEDETARHRLSDCCAALLQKVISTIEVDGDVSPLIASELTLRINFFTRFNHTWISNAITTVTDQHNPETMLGLLQGFAYTHPNQDAWILMKDHLKKALQTNQSFGGDVRRRLVFLWINATLRFEDKAATKLPSEICSMIHNEQETGSLFWFAWKRLSSIETREAKLSEWNIWIRPAALQLSKRGPNYIAEIDCFLFQIVQKDGLLNDNIAQAIVDLKTEGIYLSFSNIKDAILHYKAWGLSSSFIATALILLCQEKWCRIDHNLASSALEDICLKELHPELKGRLKDALARVGMTDLASNINY